MNLIHSETKQTLRIWTWMLSSSQGVVPIEDPDSPPPEVFVVPDEYDDEPIVLVEEDEEEAKWLMGVLNIDHDG